MKNNKAPGKRGRYLYILAGPSGSGKTTLLRSAAKAATPIFGKDNTECSYIEMLAKLDQGASRLGQIQPVEVTAGGVLSMSDFLAMAKFGLAPSCVTFLHIDLSFAVKMGYDYPKESFWRDSVGVSDPLRPELFDVSSFLRFWSYLCHDFLSGSAFSLEMFDGIAVNTLTAPRRLIVASKLARDKRKMRSPRWSHVYNSIYADTDHAHRAYEAHLAGWQKWVQQLSSMRPVIQAATQSIRENRQFLVKTGEEEHRFSAV